MEHIKEVLGSFYKPEVVHTQKVEKIAPRSVKATYVFPEYHRTQQSMGHIGVSQMTEGLVEGLYCVIAQAIEDNELDTPVDIATYIRRMADALFMRQELSYRKLLEPGEEAELTFEILKTKEELRGKYFSVTVAVKGFIRGEVDCWLPKEENPV